jgi:hypothetical protein
VFAPKLDELSKKRSEVAANTLNIGGFLLETGEMVHNK